MTDRDRILWVYSMEFVYLLVVPSPAGILILSLYFLSIQIFDYIQNKKETMRVLNLRLNSSSCFYAIMCIILCLLLNIFFLHLTTIM